MFSIKFEALTLGEKIGEGGFGVVYKGTYRFGPAAIKQLQIDNLSSEAEEEFNKEAKIMSELHHPNIVHFYGYCTVPRCLVMEYMPKGSLFKVLHNKSEPLDWNIRIRIATDIASGLAFLHSKQIWHRDIKSLNVLLDANMGARLTDFGLSKVKNETKSKTLATKTSKDAVGTVQWMAPELFRLKPTYTQKSDVYSLGITFWELASRKIPYADSIQAAISGFVQQGEREDIPADCPPKLAHLIQQCWAGNPEERPTAEKVAIFMTSDAKTLDEQTVIDAAPVSAGYQVTSQIASDFVPAEANLNVSVASFTLQPNNPGSPIATPQAVSAMVVPVPKSHVLEQQSPLGSAILTQFKDAAKPESKVNAELQVFLKPVAESEQDKAKVMLKSNPDLALVAGDVTDLSVLAPQPPENNLSPVASISSISVSKSNPPEQRNPPQSSPQTKASDFKTMSLIEAIKYNSQEEFFRLLNLKTDSSGKNLIDEVDTENGRNLLHWAAYYGHVNFITPLVKAGIDVNAGDKSGATAVYVAAQKGHAMVIAMLKAQGADVDKPNLKSERPICIATANGHAEAITALKVAGAEILEYYSWNDEENQEVREIPLAFLAALREHVAAITALADAGININIAIGAGTELHAPAPFRWPYIQATAVFCAACLGYPKVIAALHAAGANMDTPAYCVQSGYSLSGITPAYVAAQHGYVEVINALVAAGADLNRAAANGNTPMHAATTFRYEEIALKAKAAEVITALKAAGANVNTPNKKGETPLHMAAYDNKVAIVTALLNAGADASAKTSLWRGVTVLESAKGKHVEKYMAKHFENSKDSEVVRLLEAHLKQYPKGIKPVVKTIDKKESPFVALSTSLEQKTPPPSMLTQFNQTIRSSSRVNLSEPQVFLRLVAEGEQDKAEAMLKDNPALALASAEVTDLSRRTFTNITGFQYAVWALDWHMWTMIRKYLPDEVARDQAQGFETGAWVRQHGVHAQHLLEKLIGTLQSAIDLNNAQKYHECKKAWQQVGKSQLLLPVHVVNEYCHPTRPFYPIPNFQDGLVLPRSRQIDIGEWFTADGGKLGETFACERGELKLEPLAVSLARWPLKSAKLHDGDSLRVLTNTRTSQREELINELKPRRGIQRAVA